MEIRDTLPHVKIKQVIHVTGYENIHIAERISILVDALLLDSGSSQASTKILGEKGNIHDWHIGSKLLSLVNVTVFLAGGLNANNVREAIEKVKPNRVDVCNKVTTNWALYPIKLAAFVVAD